MLTYPQIDPVIFRFGPFAIRWYGLMYLLGFLAGYVLIRHLSRLRHLPLNKTEAADLLFYCVLGVVVGGRLGYVLFYDLGYFLTRPLQALAIWQGGMSFHGGLAGVVVAVSLFCWRKKLSWFLTADVLVTAATVGIGLGRLGNFINGELWGRVTEAPWGMVFPGAGPLPRHPSQLYEALLEGALLFAILYLLHRRAAAPGIPFFSFLLLYGVFRFAVEFFREPDAHIGTLGHLLTMGQVLSLPMILVGVAGLAWIHAGRRRP